MIRIISRLELEVDENNSCVACHNEDDFHDRIVNRNERHHKIDIASSEH